MFDLKDINTEDSNLILRWRNQLNIRAVMKNSDVLGKEEHEKWLKKVINSDNYKIKIFYFNNVAYGLGNFKLLTPSKEIGEWGFYIGESTATKGMGTALGYTFLNYIFDELKIRKVCAEVFDYNEISLYFHQKLGFKQDEILREHIFKNGRYCDVHLFSIFREEWLEKRPHIQAEIERNFL